MGKERLLHGWNYWPNWDRLGRYEKRFCLIIYIGWWRSLIFDGWVTLPTDTDILVDFHTRNISFETTASKQERHWNRTMKNGRYFYRAQNNWPQFLETTKKVDSVFEKTNVLPAMMSSFSEGESNRTIFTCTHCFILDPMIGIGSTWIVTNYPTEDATSSITDI